MRVAPVASSIRVALVSCPVKNENKEANVRVLEEVLRTHADSAIQLFVFPELNISGFPSATEQDCSSLAESVPDGPHAAQVIALARKYRAILCAGILERSEGHYFITHFLCGPNGYIGKQRKLFPQNPLEDGPLSAGAGLCVYHLFGHRCVVLACADWLLPEGIYLAGMHEADIILSPTDGMSLANERNMRSIALARAMDTKACLIAVFGGDTPYEGESAMAGLVATPTGGTSELLVCETRKLDEVKVVQVELMLQREPHQWGGFRARAQAFLANLAQGQTTP